MPNRLVTLTDDRAFERVGDKSREIKDERKQQIRTDKGERSFEFESCALGYPSDFDTPAIRRFCDRVRSDRLIEEEHTSEAILESLRLGRRVDASFVPNNACALLFARDPRNVFPGAFVHFLKVRGTEQLSGRDYNVEKDRRIEGNLSYIIKEVASVVDANLREFTEWVNGKFSTVREYPKDAWYELLVNACVHRSYMFKNIPIFIKVFDDRIVFESPGGFMPGVTARNIYDKQSPRNPIIMDALRLTGEVRCINEGAKRVRSEMFRAKLPEPQFREREGDAATVVATLLNNVKNRSNSLDSEAYAILGEAISLSLDVEERKIVNFIIVNEKANVSDVLRILQTTRWHTAKQKLDGLVRRSILEFFSSKLRDPNAFYQLARRGESELRS